MKENLIKKSVNKKGFTLIEMLIVVLIIGILAAIALPQYRIAVMKTKFLDMLNMGKTIAEACERYYLATNVLTIDMRDLDVSFKDAVFSNNYGMVSFPKYFCNLTTWGSIVGCFFNDSSMVSQTGFAASKNVHNCLGHKDNSLAQKTCQSITGQESFLQYGNYYYYHY